MKKLPEPDITGATGLLDNAIDRKKNENYRARLQAYKAYVKNRYSDFKTNKNKSILPLHYHFKKILRIMH